MTEKVSYACQLLSALCYLAQLKPQIVHRDIKPQNIFVKGRTCVLGDFGLLKALDGEDEVGRAVLKESGGAGMPFYYRTPDLVEYALNRAPITPKSDVFQLGLVLAHLFTGFNPCEPADDILAPVVLSGVSSIPGELGAGIATLIKRMLIADPDERPDGAALMGGWSGVFSEAVALSTKLDGKAF